MESWCFTTSFATCTGSEVPQRWLWLSKEASKQRRHLSTMPMRSDAVIFVNTQLLKSVGAYFFRSAGPWDCAASAIARSSKAAYVQWTSHLYRFIIHITTLMWVLDFTGVNPIPTTQHIPFLHIMMNNTHVTKTTQSIPLGPIGK